MKEILGVHWQQDYPLSLTQNEKAKLERVMLKRLERNADDSHYSALCSYLQAIRIIRDYPLDNQGE